MNHVRVANMYKGFKNIKLQKPKKKLAQYIIQNKEKFTKIEIQKAQQYLTWKR